MVPKQLAIGACCAMVLVARAASAEDASTHTPRRELAGHLFIPSLIVVDPFVPTYVSIFNAAGYSWIEGPDFDVAGNLILGREGERSYRAEATAQGASFQLTLTDIVAVRITGGGGLNGGSNARSALVVGMVEPLLVGVGATASWTPWPNIRVGATFDFIYSHTKLIQPLVAVQSSLVAGHVIPSRVSDKFNGYTVAPGVAVAIAPAPRWGVLASAQYSWTGLRDDTSRNLNIFSLGASAQLDLDPVGLLLSYGTQIPVESNTRFTHTVEAGVFYTGRKELVVGLDVQAKWFDLRPDRPFHLDTTQLIGIAEMRYFWN